jgi:hypothetical protein
VLVSFFFNFYVVSIIIELYVWFFCLRTLRALSTAGCSSGSLELERSIGGAPARCVQTGSTARAQLGLSKKNARRDMPVGAACGVEWRMRSIARVSVPTNLKHSRCCGIIYHTVVDRNWSSS